MPNHTAAPVTATVADDFAPSGTQEDILFGVDLRGLGWAYAFAYILEASFNDHLYAAHLQIGKALDCTMRHLVTAGMREMPTRQDEVPSAFANLRPEGSKGAWLGEGVPRVVFDDALQGIAVFFKPPGWEVDDEDKPARGRCLSGYLQWKYPWSTIARDGGHAFGIIHRLDVPSSGLILTGTTYEGYYVLKWQLDTGQIAREYVVLCHGWIAPSLQEIDAPVHHISAKSPAKKAFPEKSCSRSMVIEMGKPAQTSIRVLAHAKRGAWKFSLIVCRIRTGRRHQIRAHLLHIGHPTVADGKYTRAQVFTNDLEWCPRNFLHRQRLVFRDARGVEREATEPLTEDLRTALKALTPEPRGGRSEAAIREWISGQPPRAWAAYTVLEEHQAADASGAPPHWAGAGQRGEDRGCLSPARDADIGACRNNVEFDW